MRAAVTIAFACPNCRSPLEPDGDALACGGCGARHAVVAGVPQLFPTEGLGADWEHKQELGRAEYEHGEDENAVEVARRFAAFAQLRGLVLDIGCGISPRPAYMVESSECTYVGLDPLEGSADREFEFVRGLAEQLPFGDGTFDAVVSATMLDHVPDPGRVLGEARRVLKPEGRLALWIGVVDDRALEDSALDPFKLPARRPLRELVRRYGVAGTARRAGRHLFRNRVRALLTRLRLRFRRSSVIGDVYAERSRYHFSFFQAGDVEPLLVRTGFRTLRTERVSIGTAGTSLFVLAVPA